MTTQLVPIGSTEIPLVIYRNQPVVTLDFARKAPSFRAGMQSAANAVRLLFWPHSQPRLFEPDSTNCVRLVQPVSLADLSVPIPGL